MLEIFYLIKIYHLIKGVMCRFFGKKFLWNNKCQENFQKESMPTKSNNLAINFEINCDVLCRIGQGGRACSCA